MGFTDKMCHDVAKDIINKIFLVKYTLTIKEDIPWYENLNNFLVVEWDRLQESEDTQTVTAVVHSMSQTWAGEKEDMIHSFSV